MDSQLIEFLREHGIEYHDGIKGAALRSVIRQLYALHDAEGVDEDGCDNETGIFCREILDLLGEEYYD